MERTTASRTARVKRLQDVVTYVGKGLIEREAQARCLVLAALCGEHVLFIGPPGTAKSELARRLHRVVGGRYFERLLTRFTVPEELFGPLSLAALDEGRYERDIDGYLPTASIAFLDEVFKANSAILNALLTLLHEREFDQGALRIAAPLVTVVGASNEIPEEESLRAFFDRFLFRCPVAPVSDAGFVLLLDLRDEAPPADGPRLDVADLGEASAAGEGVHLPQALHALLVELRRFVVDHGIEVTDRRWVRIVRALRIAAASNDRDEVGFEDLAILPYLVAENAEQARLVDDWYATRLGAGEIVDLERTARVVQAFEKQIDLEASATELAFDDSGKLALMQSVGGAESQAMSGAAPRMSAFSRRKRYGATHIGARLAQIDAVLAEIGAFVGVARRHSEALRARLQANLWVEPRLADRLAGVVLANRDRALAQREALQRVREAFAALPLTDEDDGRVPPPMDVEQ